MALSRPGDRETDGIDRDRGRLGLVSAGIITAARPAVDAAASCGAYWKSASLMLETAPQVDADMELALVASQDKS